MTLQSMTNGEPSCANSEFGPELYAQWRDSVVGDITDRLEQKLILDLAGDVGGRWVLDVGCGDGALAGELWKRGAVVVGIDASPAIIEPARARAREHKADIAFYVATAEHLPFPTHQFDLVTAITILCFVENAAPVFADVARVLRPGGRFVIGELGKWSLWAVSRRMRAWFGSQLWRMARFRTANELQALAKQAGLIPGPVRGSIYYPRSAVAARLLSPYDPLVGRYTTVGAAFLALSATKPGAETQARDCIN